MQPKDETDNVKVNSEAEIVAKLLFLNKYAITQKRSREVGRTGSNIPIKSKKKILDLFLGTTSTAATYGVSALNTLFRSLILMDKLCQIVPRQPQLKNMIDVLSDNLKGCELWPLLRWATSGRASCFGLTFEQRSCPSLYTFNGPKQKDHSVDLNC